ncbi:MAG: hypothetical protein IT462_08535 [Planctomycetes bacterium]|nr:hypothetical protein [Planctomycetota bacterium]
MHGLLIGAIIGIGALACLSAVRSFRTRRGMAADARVSRGVLIASAALQLALGICCIAAGIWMMIAWAPV